MFNFLEERGTALQGEEKLVLGVRPKHMALSRGVIYVRFKGRDEEASLHCHGLCATGAEWL